MFKFSGPAPQTAVSGRTLGAVEEVDLLGQIPSMPAVAGEGPRQQEDLYRRRGVANGLVGRE